MEARPPGPLLSMPLWGPCLCAAASSVSHDSEAWCYIRISPPWKKNPPRRALLICCLSRTPFQICPLPQRRGCCGPKNSRRGRLFSEADFSRQIVAAGGRHFREVRSYNGTPATGGMRLSCRLFSSVPSLVCIDDRPMPCHEQIFLYFHLSGALSSEHSNLMHLRCRRPSLFLSSRPSHLRQLAICVASPII